MTPEEIKQQVRECSKINTQNLRAVEKALDEYYMQLIHTGDKIIDLVQQYLETIGAMIYEAPCKPMGSCWIIAHKDSRIVQEVHSPMSGYVLLEDGTFNLLGSVSIAVFFHCMKEYALVRYAQDHLGYRTGNIDTGEYDGDIYFDYEED